MNNVLEMRISTPEQYINAIRLSQNAFLKRTVINIQNQGYSFSEPLHFIEDIRYGADRMYDKSRGRFANAQISGYSLSMETDIFARFCKMIIDVQYFNNQKEFNDLICVAAEIAELLCRKVQDPENEYEKLMIFNSWIKRNFKYKTTDTINDHAAINLLKSQGGVCQAIAALAVMILSYMGIKTLYISGEGKGEDGWGPHAWNAAMIDHRWIHFDFTFSIESPHLPSTKTEIEERIFRNAHKWDQQEYSIKQLNSKWRYADISRKNYLHLCLNDAGCIIDGVNIMFEKPIMIFRESKKWIDLSGLVRIIGGGVELVPSSGVLNICVNNKRFSIKNGTRLYKDSYFDIDVLDLFARSVWNDRSKSLQLEI